MHERYDEFVHEDQCAADSANDDTLPNQKHNLNGWFRRTFNTVRERNGLITMTPDGRITRVDRVEPT